MRHFTKECGVALVALLWASVTAPVGAHLLNVRGARAKSAPAGRAAANGGGAAGRAAVAFVGDSITQGWTLQGQKTWTALFADLPAVALGHRGESSRRLTKRLQKGLLDGVSPRVVVVLIGTNEIPASGKISPGEVAAGVSKVVDTVRQRAPQAKIVLMGVLPRGARPGSLRTAVADVNRELSTTAGVSYLDVTSALLEPDGTLSRRVMGDLLHPSAEGYRRIGAELEPLVKSLLAE